MLHYEKEQSTFLFYNEENSGVGSVMTTEADNTLSVDSVYVKHEFRGQGMAAVMMEQVVAYCQSANKELIPICSYAVAYIEKHKGE